MTDAAGLRALHMPGRPLVLPNAWDVASAKLVASAGFPAVATSSAAVAAVLGFTDDDTMPPEEAFGAVARIAAAVDVPVTADIEAGYGLTPEELGRRLVAAGASGCNFEDTDHHGTGGLRDVAEQTARIKALSSAGDLVVNARIDVFLHARAASSELIDEAVTRARAYRDAGADCVYPITLTDTDAIARLVDAGGIVNILAMPGAPSIAQLAELGVARVSFGSGIYRATYADAERRLAELRAEIGDR